MSRQFRQTVSPTLFVRRGTRTELPLTPVCKNLEHCDQPLSLPTGVVVVVWNLVTLGQEEDGASQPFRFHPQEGVVFAPPPGSKVEVVRAVGRISSTQWALVVRNDRQDPDVPVLLDYTYRLIGPDEVIYGPPIDPAIVVTPHPTIPPG